MQLTRKILIRRLVRIERLRANLNTISGPLAATLRKQLLDEEQVLGIMLRATPPRKRPLYGLFERMGKQWIRHYPAIAYIKEDAIRLFQTALLEGTLQGRHMELRPIKGDPDENLG